MSLVLRRDYYTGNYANPYNTNRNYLDNMTNLQMKLLNKMIWVDHSYIRDSFSLWILPTAMGTEKEVKESMKYFIRDLNEDIMRL